MATKKTSKKTQATKTAKKTAKKASKKKSAAKSTSPLTPKQWLNQFFAAKQAKNNGIIRRSISSVAKHCSEAQLLAEVKGRGFHLVKTNTQYIVICDPAGSANIMC